MLARSDSEHDDLRGGATPWRKNDAQAPRPSVHTDLQCDVLIVGGGITGAMMAARLAGDGRRICIVDRERPGFGSTAASTSMLLWEIDTSLARLTDLYGFEKASDIYRRSYRATQLLCETLLALPESPHFLTRNSLYLAAAEIGDNELRAEMTLRHRAGLPGDYLDYRALLQQFGIAREAALLSPGSAEADPRLMVDAFLRLASERGVRVFEDDATVFHTAPGCAAVELGSGHAIEARHVVLATGYALPDMLRSDLHRVTSSWAIATQPQNAASLWPGPALIWEASTNYIYARTTQDRRIVIGGEDDDRVSSQEDRDRLTPDKAAALRKKLKALWPAAEGDIEYAWSGAFGVTRDGLPMIGKISGYPGFYAAYGYGGNGITFSFLAAEIIAALIRGEYRPWFDHFAVDRVP